MIADALVRLMARKPFAQITVTEICSEACVGRKTFYRNFELREDAIDFLLDHLVEQYRSEITELSTAQHLHHHLEFIARHAALLILLYQNGFHETVSMKFSAFLPDTMPLWSHDSIKQQYRSQYIIAGIEAIVRVWIERGFQESITDIEHIIEDTQQKLTPLPENEKSDSQLR